MPKKRKGRVPKGNVVWHQSAEEATLAGKPHFNGYACGHGAHGDAKYNRARAKRAWRRQLGQEGASRGSLSFLPSGYRRVPGCVRRAAASVFGEETVTVPRCPLCPKERFSRRAATRKIDP